MKVLLNALYYLFITCIVIVALLLFATVTPIPGNVKAKVVKSGSMEPAIKTGDLVIIAPSKSYEVGDVITFGPDTKAQIPTTHRIVAIEGENFQTKGDANEEPDPVPAALTDVSGKVILTVPFLGYVLDFARTPLGFVLVVGVPALAIIAEEIGKIVREVRSMKKKKTSHAKVKAKTEDESEEV